MLVTKKKTCDSHSHCCQMKEKRWCWHVGTLTADGTRCSKNTSLFSSTFCTDKTSTPRLPSRSANRVPSGRLFVSPLAGRRHRRRPGFHATLLYGMIKLFQLFLESYCKDLAIFIFLPSPRVHGIRPRILLPSAFLARAVWPWPGFPDQMWRKPSSSTSSKRKKNGSRLGIQDGRGNEIPGTPIMFSFLPVESCMCVLDT